MRRIGIGVGNIAKNTIFDIIILVARYGDMKKTVTKRRYVRREAVQARHDIW